MTDIILLLVIALLLFYIAWDKYETRKQQNKLINAIISKNANELAATDLADNTKIELPKNEEPDLVPFEGLSEDEFDEHIKESLHE